MGRERCDEEFVPRQVIHERLLTALDEHGKVAILASERDLDLMIYALEMAARVCASASTLEELSEFVRDLQQLKQSAFR